MKGFVILNPQDGEIYSTRVENDPMIYRSKVKMADGRQISGLFHCEGFDLRSRYNCLRAFENLFNFGDLPEVEEFSIGLFRAEDLRGIESMPEIFVADYVAVVLYEGKEKRWLIEQNVCAFSTSTSAANILLGDGNSPIRVIETLSRLPEYSTGYSILKF